MAMEPPAMHETTILREARVKWHHLWILMSKIFTARLSVASVLKYFWLRHCISLQLGAGGLKERTLESMKTCALLPPAKLKKNDWAVSTCLCSMFNWVTLLSMSYICFFRSVIDSLTPLWFELQSWTFKCWQHHTGVSNNISRLHHLLWCILRSVLLLALYMYMF